MLAKPPSGAAYGWRARLALLAAHPGPENIPYEFYLMAPDGVTLIVTSHRYRHPTVRARQPRGSEGRVRGRDAARGKRRCRAGRTTSRCNDATRNARHSWRRYGALRSSCEAGWKSYQERPL